MKLVVALAAVFALAAGGAQARHECRVPKPHRRCLVTATQVFEWAGPKGDKTMWRFSKVDA